MIPVFLASAVVILVGSVSGSAQVSEAEEKSLQRMRELAHSVMVKVVAGDDAGALELLRKDLPVPKAEFDALLKKTVESRRAYRDRFGKILEYKLVREERVSDFLMRLTYVEKRANHLIRWQFTFYRPSKEWRLNSFVWDDNAAALFEPAKATK